MKTRNFGLSAVILALALGAAPAAADQIEEALEMALEAYRAGDIAVAKEEIDFAAQLIAQKKAAALADYLPEPLPGWTRRDDEGGGQAAFGGMTASATYLNEVDRKRVEVQLIANNQMVSAMAAMFSNPAIMGSAGTLKRINRQKVMIDQQGQLQTVVDNRILITISGNAPAEDKEAYFAAIDLEAVADF